MLLLRLSLVVLFSSFTLWAQVPGSNPEAGAHVPGRTNAAVFGFSNQDRFSTTSVRQALQITGSAGIGRTAPAGIGTLRLATASASHLIEAPVQFDPNRVSFPLPDSQAAPAQKTPTRPKAVSYSDAYLLRRKIHKYASFATMPLFVAEAVVGQKLYDGNGSESLRGVHSGLAAGVAVLFGVNSVTGVWNLWEARKDPNGRTKRMVHGILMLGADAGFVATGALAPDEEEGRHTQTGSGRSTHRTVALTSMGVAAISYLYMLIAR
jgi:hypothetical protein